MKTLQKIFFRLRAISDVRSKLRRLWWQAQGARFGKNTNVPPLLVSWPHQVSIGANCALEPEILFKFDGIWQAGPSIVVGDRVFLGRGCEFNIQKGIEIGADCLIASGCKFIDHDHGFAIGQPMNVQLGAEAAISIGADVWLGVNVVVLKGVVIERGAIVAAGAIVTKNVGANEIWAGVPARKIGQRPESQA